ncbi:unnamed protein product [Rotaria socialis]|uniref:Uncharacterized protein n=2 Tax=Rotaria socialis TaxID=392032 RepID=A0A817P334_9BILA|nr:unnamed protein product [Rotaria socialis]
MNGLTTGNLLRNGDFSQLEFDGQPSIWNITGGQDNTSVTILPRKYLSLNAVEISVYTTRTLVKLTQTIQLEHSTNKSLLVMTFWHRTWIIYGSGSIQLEFYDSSNYKIGNEYVKSFSRNLTWSYVRITRPIRSYAISAKIVIQMYNSMGVVLMANISIEQVDVWKNATFFVSPRQDGTIFIQWNLENHGNTVANYDIYRSKGILSTLDDTHLLVTIPTMSSYGKNIYESMYTDHFVHLDTIYTYQVVARHSNRTIIDRTILIIGQADLGEDYYNITTLIALPRINGIHLSWKLRSKSTANKIILYNGIDSVFKINNSRAQLVGIYPVQDMKAIVELSNTGPFLLVSDDGNDIATVKFANLTRSRIVLTPTHLDFVREKTNQSGHAQEVFKALIKSIYTYQPDNSFNYCWSARDAALLYAITRDINYVHMAYSALNANRINYTIYDESAVKLRFSLSTMARVQAFDWAYYAFTIQQRQELIKDFQYAASIFTSYSDDHSRNSNDKASNWMGIVKSSELILHLTLYGEERYPNDQAERRILFLLHELKLHLEHSYGPSGYMQEGLSYLAYTLPILGPAVYLAKSMGISILDDAWFRPDWHNLALHIISLRKRRNSLQFGVSDSTYSYNGFLPFIFNSTNDRNIKAALKWFYDRTMGINSSSPAYDGKDKSAALLYYPYEIVAQHPSVVFPRSTSMINDNVDGFYGFRNRYRDQNDVLIGLMNRNRRHAGWNANETFALSIMSHDTTWARMPGKEFQQYNVTRKFSTPLIDGWPREPPKGTKLGYTKAIKPFSDQGGGYVSIDSSVNLNITLASRDILVDMITRGNIDTIIAIHDQFVDILSHFWHWQISPDPDETNITLGNENNLSTFIIRGQNGSWLKGWLYNHQHATYNNTENVLRIIKQGFTANFKIVMALGMGTEPVAYRIATGINIDKACINFDALFQGLQCVTTTVIISTTATPGIKIPSIIIISITSTLVGLVVLIIVAILIRKIINRNNRIRPTLEIKPTVS